MTIYHFTLPWVVLDSVTGLTVPNRNDGVLLALDGTQAQATTPLGVATPIVTGPAGTTVPFQASIPAGRVRFGSVEAPVFADENLDAADRAEAAAATAVTALESIKYIGANASEVTYFRRDPDGSLWITDTPVVSGGGKPRVVNGAVYVDFPL